jgi:hypothetical protein
MPDHGIAHPGVAGVLDGIKQEAQFKLDQTQPATFKKWQNNGQCTGGFISIPLPRFLDVVLPLAALTTAQETLFLWSCCCTSLWCN